MSTREFFKRIELEDIIVLIKIYGGLFLFMLIVEYNLTELWRLIELMFVVADFTLAKINFKNGKKAYYVFYLIDGIIWTIFLIKNLF